MGHFSALLQKSSIVHSEIIVFAAANDYCKQCTVGMTPLQAYNTILSFGVLFFTERLLHG